MFHAIIGICTGRKDAVTRAVPVDDDDRSDVRAYLEAMVGKGDTVALLAVSRWKSAAVVQEIQRVEDLARPEAVRRLDALNRDGYDVYCTVNPESAIRSRRIDEVGSVCEWPDDLVQAGDWSPVQWFDPKLAEAALQIREASGLCQLNALYDMEPAGQRSRVSYPVSDSMSCRRRTRGPVPRAERARRSARTDGLGNRCTGQPFTPTAPRRP